MSDETVLAREKEAVTRKPFGMAARESLLVGAGSVPPALIIGSVLGAFRSSHPTAFALAFTVQWFTFGSTFWATRSFLTSPPTYTLRPLSLEPYPKTASTVSAGFSGALVGLLARGRRSVVPGAVTFSVLGYLGHTAFAAFETKQSFMQRDEKLRKDALAAYDSGMAAETNGRAEDNLLQRLARSKWSPMTVVSDEEHRRMLMRRKGEIEDEMKAVDQEIAKLREEEMKQAQRASAEKP